MSLATSNKNLSICTVYYTIDDDFNLYFISEPSSNHCLNITNNTQVACAIADSRQKVTDKKAGVQVEGSAQQLQDDNQIKLVLDLWNKSNPGFEKIINIANIKNGGIKSKVYKIQPKIIKFFSEELYGPEGFENFVFNFYSTSL